jgi:uncharacterized membrane protein
MTAKTTARKEPKDLLELLYNRKMAPFPTHSSASARARREGAGGGVRGRRQGGKGLVEARNGGGGTRDPERSKEG